MREPQDKRSHPGNVGLSRRGQSQMSEDRGETESKPENSTEIKLETQDDAEGRVREGVPSQGEEVAEESRN